MSNIKFIAPYQISSIPNATIEECANYISKLNVIGIDIETSRKYELGVFDETVYKGGLDPYLSRVIMLQVGDVERQYVIDVRKYSKEELQPILDILNYNKDVVLVGHNCLPKYTDVLTSRGWKSISEVTTQDTVYGFEDGNIISQEVLAVVSKEDEVVRLSNSQRCFDSTKKHRWLVESRNGQIGYKNTEDLLGTRNKIILNGIFNEYGEGVDLTDDELTLFTWAVTDGRIKWYKDSIANIEITQSYVNVKFVKELEQLCQKFDAKEFIVKTKGYTDCKRFYIRSKEARYILSKINYHKNFNFCEFVLQLTERQLDIFFKTFWKAEGFKKGKDELSKLIFAQQTKGYKNDTRDAIALSLYMKGYTIGASKEAIRAKKRTKADCRTLQQTSLGVQKVHCLTTPCSNFVVRQGDQIFITGNCKFEAKHLKHNYLVNFHTIYDTMLGELILYNGIPMGIGLADLAERYLGVKKKSQPTLFKDKKVKRVTLDDDLLNESDAFITPFEVSDQEEIDKITRMQFLNIGDKDFTYEQVAYGADDIIYPILIRERQLVGRKLADGYVHKPSRWIKNEMHFCLVLADIELNGMPILRDKWQELYEKNLIVFNRRKTQLDQYIIKNNLSFSGTMDMFSQAPTCAIQWTSNKQVATFFKSLNMCPKAYSKTTKKVDYTVEATHLLRTLPNTHKIQYDKNVDVEEIKNTDDLKLAYLLFKKSELAITTFGLQWFKFIHPITKRAHSNYRQILNTTRISSTSPNCNNVSNGTWRDCFKVGEGKKMINLDYSTQEVRHLAQVTKDQALIDFFTIGDEQFGEDFHSFTATKVYKALENNPKLLVPPKEINGEKNPAFTPEHGEKRTNSKAFTFGMMYGKTAYTFAQDLGITVEEAEAIMNSYMVAFEGLNSYFKEAEQNSISRPYIIIDKYTGALWNCNFFGRIEELLKEYYSFFPEGYEKLPKTSRNSVRQRVYEEHPEAKEKMREIGRLRAALKNKNQNYPIQGGCSQMMKIAMNMARKEIIEKQLTLKLIGNIYDEVLGEDDVEKAEEGGKLLKKCMEVAGNIIAPDVPQVANYVIADGWGH